jgi:hypothetical protein
MYFWDTVLADEPDLTRSFRQIGGRFRRHFRTRVRQR